MAAEIDYACEEVHAHPFRRRLKGRIVGLEPLENLPSSRQLVLPQSFLGEVKDTQPGKIELRAPALHTLNNEGHLHGSFQKVRGLGSLLLPGLPA